MLEAEAAPGVRFHVAGRPHVKDAVYHWMLRDLRLLIPAALRGAGRSCCAVSFGTRRGVLLPLGVVAIAIALDLRRDRLPRPPALDPHHAARRRR